MARAVEAGVAAMAARHSRFLEEMNGDLVGILKAENLRLERELSELKDRFLNNASLRKPPIPPVPSQFLKNKVELGQGAALGEQLPPLSLPSGYPAQSQSLPATPSLFHDVCVESYEDLDNVGRPHLHEMQLSPGTALQHLGSPSPTAPAPLITDATAGTLLPGEFPDAERSSPFRPPAPHHDALVRNNSDYSASIQECEYTMMSSLSALNRSTESRVLKEEIDHTKASSPTAMAVTVTSPSKIVTVASRAETFSLEDQLLAHATSLTPNAANAANGESVKSSPSLLRPMSPTVTVGMSNSMVMKAHAAMDPRRRIREIRRLRYLLTQHKYRRSTVNEDDLHLVSGEMLRTALSHRDPEFDLDQDTVDECVGAFVLIERGVLPMSSTSTLAMEKVSVHALVDIIWMKDLKTHLPRSLIKAATVIVDALRNPTPKELVHEATRMSYEGQPKQATTRDFKWFLSWLVSIVVSLNMIIMGISVDRNPEGIHWAVFEIFCTSVYVFEMVYWLRKVGPQEFFRGESAWWNISDSFVTLIACFQVALEILTRIDSAALGEGSNIASATRATIMLRALRAVRVMRLVKMVRSPMVRQFANMLVGFLIGLPSLFWVLFMLCLILCLFGLFSRIMFGPSPERPVNYWYNTCGFGDDLLDFNDPNCPVHYVYGEEYFGTVGKSMFTCFRFMLGDYSTRGGKSIVVAFSQDYGFQFDAVFVMWMIVVIFGIFNIITAIFVDTTTAGLKHNDNQRKHRMQYEREFVKDRLSAFLSRTKVLQDMETSVAVKTRITEDQFLILCEDEEVRRLLQDLDVEVSNLPTIFSAFDADASGCLSMQELTEGIMRLRGDPQKTDIVGCWVSARLLHDKVDALFRIVEMRLGGLEAPGIPQKRSNAKLRLNC